MHQLLINSYPIIEPVQTRGVFELNEKLIVNSVLTDLLVVEIRDDYIKTDGKFEIKNGDKYQEDLVMFLQKLLV